MAAEAIPPNDIPTKDKTVGEMIDTLAESLTILRAAAHEVEYIDAQAGRATCQLDRDMVVRRAQSGECLISIAERMIFGVQERLWDLREPMA